VSTFLLSLVKRALTVNRRARDSLLSAAHPLLKAIGLYTGCYVTLIAAAIPSVSGDAEYFSACVAPSHPQMPTDLRPPSVHHVPDGKTSRQNWTEWDQVGFRTGVTRSYKKYIKSMGKLVSVVHSLEC